MSALTTKQFAGWGVLKKTDPTSGGGAIAHDAEVTIPSMVFNPRDPYNNVYVPVVNKSAYPSTMVLGKHTPSVGIRTVARTSFVTKSYLESLLLTTDANGDTDQWCIAMNDGVTTRKWGKSRCAALSLAGNGMGGPLALELGFLTADPASTESVSTPSTVVGTVLNSAMVDFGASTPPTGIRSWRLNLLRGVAYDMFMGGKTLYPDDTSCGMLGGTLDLEFSPGGANIPSSTFTLRMYTGTPASPTLHLTLALALNLDEPVLTVDTGFGNQVNTYTLIDTGAGGCPVTVT